MPVINKWMQWRERRDPCYSEDEDESLMTPPPKTRPGGGEAPDTPSTPGGPPPTPFSPGGKPNAHYKGLTDVEHQYLRELRGGAVQVDNAVDP